VKTTEKFTCLKISSKPLRKEKESAVIGNISNLIIFYHFIKQIMSLQSLVIDRGVKWLRHIIPTKKLFKLD